VALAQSQGMDKADSDEDEEDDHKACEITIAQAVSCAEQLEKSSLHLPVLNSFVQSRCLHWLTRGASCSESKWPGGGNPICEQL
jgi:hypothetical protein